MKKKRNTLEIQDVQELDIYATPFDLRRDLHTLICYLQERKVKQTRGNRFIKADSLRLARLIGQAELIKMVQQQGSALWIELLIGLAVNNKWIRPARIEDDPFYEYWVVDDHLAEQWSKWSLQEQEQFLLNIMIGEKNGRQSEFFRPDALSRLDRFADYNSSTSVVPQIDFVQARRFLLQILNACEAGVWYSTASLIQYIREQNRYFLIPRHVQYDKRGRQFDSQYSNFREACSSTFRTQIEILPTDPDAFERIEGRYVERFLEGVPLILGYVDVAFRQSPNQDIFPSRNHLQAFRVNSRFKQMSSQNIPPPRVTVQPNMEVYVESECYPLGLMAQLAPLGQITASGAVTVLHLRKDRVAAHVAAHPDLDPVGLLTRLSQRALPQNVQRELIEWSAHADKFVLYRGFGLFEADEPLPDGNPHRVESISPHLQLVSGPKALFEQLHRSGQTPLLLNHLPGALTAPPDSVASIVARPAASPVAKPKEKPAALVSRQTHIRLGFTDRTLLERFRQALLEQRCPAQVEPNALQLIYEQKYDPLVQAAIQSISQEYDIRFLDI